MCDDEGKVHDRVRRLLEPVVVDVAHLPDDGVPAATEQTNALAERTRAGPVPFGEGVAHDRLAQGTGGILRTERLAAEERDAQCLEIMAIHVRDGVLGAPGVRLRRTALDLDGHVMTVAAERYPVGQCHIARARDRLRLADQGLEEAQARGGPAVAGIGEQHTGGDDVSGVEAGPHLLQAKEAAYHQPRRRDEHDGQRDL